jgi:endo-1,4-beta-xylanase
MKPQFVHPQPNVYDFTEADMLVDFAAANGVVVHAHTLVWFEALPPWMRLVTAPAAVKQMMLDHIDHVAGHFRGKVAEWDVVNEPMSDEDVDYTNGNQGVRPILWFQAMGEAYIDEALRKARAVDPTAQLYINEYGVEEDGPRWDALYALVQRLKARNVPLDGIGFQNHEYAPADRTPAATFRAKVRALAGLGLKARISEMDVIASPAESAIQATQFSGKATVCRQEPNCTGYSTWGMTDLYGSTAGIQRYPPSPGDALLFDVAFKPKPAFTAVQTALRP